MGVDVWHRKPGRGEVTDPGKFVAFEAGPGRFPLVAQGKAAPLVVSSSDAKGVLRVVNDLKADVARVTKIDPAIQRDQMPGAARRVVLVGTLGKSPLVDDLVKTGKLDPTGIRGKWETFLLQVVEQPQPGIDQALVIAGSDQRGTIYGVYELSRQMGVSPWHWWDDVPARFRSALYVLPGRHSQGEPAVKYRGLFINDENPALGTWVPHQFGPAPNPSFPGGFGHRFYAAVFEVMLRLRANYLWPAVWGRAFAEDDPENQALADEYGVVMGTSHEAPMNRGIEEWNRHVVVAKRDLAGQIIEPGKDPYGGTGEWSFRRNAAAVRAFWTEGIRRMKSSEVVVTLGMRGPGDVGLPDAAGIELMNGIVQAERSILAEVTGKDLTTIPQVWTLYKEVQRYWDDGMRAPDDVTIVWCDDNWGNLRELPKQSDPERGGGYGIYYHFDYVGGGRNYKWVDTNLLPNVWEQLHLAYRYGVDRLWVVNVGDLKNEELPLEFFLDYAWNPERWPVERLGAWEEQWAEQQFGPEWAYPIARVLHRYARLQSRRKPELLNRRITLDPAKDVAKEPDAAVVYRDDSPFSLTHYRELERVVAEWRRLAVDAEAIKKGLPPAYRDAYYQLVYYQVEASRLLYELRLAEFRNILYARQGRAATEEMAGMARTRFAQGASLAAYYNDILAGGKWKGFQTQPYVGYGDMKRYGDNASWQQPEKDNQTLPDAIYPPLVSIEVPRTAKLGVAIDGSDRVWPGEASPAILPTFSPYQNQPAQYIEVFQRGAAPTKYRITVPPAAAGWLEVTPSEGVLGDDKREERANVSVDWSRAPSGVAKVPINVTSANTSVIVNAAIDNRRVPESWTGFVESNGYVSMEAGHFQRSVKAPQSWWQEIPDIGRTAAGMTPFPVNATRQTPGGTSPRLEYDVYLFGSGKVRVWAYLSPRNNVLHGDGLKYAVSFDEVPPQTVNVTTALNGIPMNRSWERNTSDNVNLTSTTHDIGQAGPHVLKFWMVDPTVIVQKLVLDMGGLEPSYLGPPESRRLGGEHQ